jgi:transketolase
MTDLIDRHSALQHAERFDCRESYVETLIDLAQTDHRVVGIVNDSVGSSKLDAFRKAFPDRLINVGIAEQDMVGVAAGLANGGRLPFVSAASCFLTARALEQIKVDAAYSDYNIKLCGMSPGVAYGELGPTHHSIEDIAWLRAIDNLSIAVPADPIETGAALRWAARHTGPVFVRVSRMPVPLIHGDDYQYVPGRAQLLRDGSDLTMISNGTVLWRCLVAAERLAERGVAARVLSMPSIRPFDRAAVQAAAEETGAVLTAEESTSRGGLGGAVAETLVEVGPAPARLLGINTFAPTGSADYLLDRCGMSIDGLVAAAQDLLARKH